MFADKNLSPLPGLITYNILSGGLRPRLLSFRLSGARPATSPGLGRHILRGSAGTFRNRVSRQKLTRFDIRHFNLEFRVSNFELPQLIIVPGFPVCYPIAFFNLYDRVIWP